MVPGRTALLPADTLPSGLFLMQPSLECTLEPRIWKTLSPLHPSHHNPGEGPTHSLLSCSFASLPFGFWSRQLIKGLSLLTRGKNMGPHAEHQILLGPGWGMLDSQRDYYMAMSWNFHGDMRILEATFFPIGRSPNRECCWHNRKQLDECGGGNRECP